MSIYATRFEAADIKESENLLQENDLFRWKEINIKKENRLRATGGSGRRGANNVLDLNLAESCSQMTSSTSEYS